MEAKYGRWYTCTGSGSGSATGSVFTLVMSGLILLVVLLFGTGGGDLPPVPIIIPATNGVALSWDPSPDYSVVGYNLYQGVGSRAYTNSINVGNVLRYVAPKALGAVTNFYCATSYDANGIESDYSNEVAINPPPPSYGLIFLQTSTNGVSFYDLSVTPYLRLTNGAGGPLPWQWFRSRTETTTNWR